MNLKNVGALLLVGALAAGSLMRYSGGNQTATPKESGSEIMAQAGKTAGKQEKITLRSAWWGNERRHQATLKVIELYTDRNPNVTIEVEYKGFDDYQQKISARLARQTTPDIMQLSADWISDYVNKGDSFTHLQGYPDLMDVSEFGEEFLNSFCAPSDQFIALPTGMNARAAYMNKVSAERFGLDISPDNKLTWEGCIGIGKRAREQDPNSYLLVTDPRLTAIYVVKGYIQQTTGEQATNDDYTISFDKEVLANASDLMQRMYDEKAFEPTQDSAAFNDVLYTNPRVASGELPASFGWISNISKLNGLIGADNIQVIPTPVPGNTKDTIFSIRPTQVMPTPTSCESKEEALRFLNLFSSDEETGKILGDVRPIPSMDKIRTIRRGERILGDNSVITIDYDINHSGKVENDPPSDTEVGAVFTNAAEKTAYHKGIPGKVADETMKPLEDVLNTLK